MDIIVNPAPLGKVQLAAPDSKSDIHRKLICAALCRTETFIGTVDTDYCDDVLATVGCLRSLGAEITVVPGKGLRVLPIRTAASVPVLDCRESGSTLRFLVPVAAGLYDECRVTGADSLIRRPLAPLLEAMASHGKSFDSSFLPLVMKGSLLSGEYVLPGNISSQFISGLLFTLPFLEGDSTVRLTSELESAEYAEMTIRVLELFGIEIGRLDRAGSSAGSAGDRGFVGGFSIRGGQRFVSPGIISAERDWSSCAFLIPFGVGYTGLDENSLQPDRAVKKYMEMMIPGREVGELHIDVSSEPDLVPILSVMACSVMGRVFLENGARLRMKESDRLTSCAAMIRALGGNVTELADSLVIEGCGSLEGGTVESFNDHRIVMAAAAAAVLCRTPVTIRGAEAVNKSYPGFFRDFTRAGGSYNVI